MPKLDWSAVPEGFQVSEGRGVMLLELRDPGVAQGDLFADERQTDEDSSSHRLMAVLDRINGRMGRVARYSRQVRV